MVVVAAMVLAGCATQAVPPAAKSSIRNVAIISLIGDQIQFEKSGMTVFEGDLKAANFEWGIDRLASQAVEDRIRRANPGITVTRLGYDPAVLAGIYDREPVNLLGREYADPSRVESPLRGIVAGQPVDTLLLVTRNKVQHGLDMPGWREGPGLHLIKPWAGPATRVLLFAALQIHVIDTRTLKRIAQHAEIARERKYFDGPIWSPPPPTPFTTTASLPLTTEQEIFLRGELARIIPETLAAMVTPLGL